MSDPLATAVLRYHTSGRRPRLPRARGPLASVHASAVTTTSPPRSALLHTHGFGIAAGRLARCKSGNWRCRPGSPSSAATTPRCTAVVTPGGRTFIDCYALGRRARQRLGSTGRGEREGPPPLRTCARCVRCGIRAHGSLRGRPPKRRGGRRRRGRLSGDVRQRARK